MWFAVLSAACVNWGHTPPSRAEFEKTFGQATVDDIAQFFPGPSLAEVEVFYAAECRRHLHLVNAVDGAAAVLRHLRDAGVRLAVATNATRAFAEPALHHAGLGGLVTTFACADEVPAPKPAPDVVRLAAARLGVALTECVMVGDSSYDVRSARAAPCAVVGIEVDADLRLPRITDVVAALGY